jgi:hypothetical protein
LCFSSSFGSAVTLCSGSVVASRMAL